MIFKLVSFDFNAFDSKSIFTSASNSLKTISILSVPMPVDITEIRLLPIYPVCVINSLFPF
ncbi:hypothetical protein D3C87_1941930 [compost metagenome]